MKSFEFGFYFGSPAAYLAWTQIPSIEAATGATAQFKPMLLGAPTFFVGDQMFWGQDRIEFVKEVLQ